MSLDNLFHLLGQVLACPFGNFATCGAKGIPRCCIQHLGAMTGASQAPFVPQLIASLAIIAGTRDQFDSEMADPNEMVYWGSGA